MAKAESEVVVITGCSEGGIGYALAREFQQQGCQVFATARRVEAMKGLEELGIKTMQLDVTSTGSIQAAVSKVVSSAGRVDILVNNAGMGLGGPAADVSLDGVRRLYETNLFGAIAMAQAVFPHMAARKSGKIVNLGSVAAYVHRPWNCAYASSKAALTAATNCMRLEMKPFGIQVMLVVPGSISTNIFSTVVDNLQPLPSGSFYKPYEAAIRGVTEVYRDNPKATPVATFARKVVKQTLKRQTPWRFIMGYHSSLAMFVSRLPMWLRDIILWGRYGKKSEGGQGSKQA